MSSNYRDVGEAHRDLYFSIPSDLSGISREQAVEMLKSIREGAKDDYDTFARFMGWQEIEDIEQEEKEGHIHPLPPRERYSFKMREFWLREHMQLPAATSFEANIVGETPKAYHVEADGWSGWLPKSLIKSQVKIEGAESLQNFPDTEKSKYI
jgi:hypothetical protein